MNSTELSSILTKAENQVNRAETIRFNAIGKAKDAFAKKRGNVEWNALCKAFKKTDVINGIEVIRHNRKPVGFILAGTKDNPKSPRIHDIFTTVFGSALCD